jgi:hypothetical protein
MRRSSKQQDKNTALPIAARLSPVRTCEQFSQLGMTPDEQRETAELAFNIWLARAFRCGSPQEDWIEAMSQRAARQ